MKRFGYVIAALGAIAIAAPSIASAETVVIKKHERHFGDHRFCARVSPTISAITAPITKAPPTNARGAGIS